MDYPPIPWVFTKEQINLVDTRCKRVVLPSNCPAFCTTKAGIFEDSSAFWRLVSNYTVCIHNHIERTVIITFRMSSKLQVFLMLPVLFMATVPALHQPLTKLAYAVALLIGRVMSERFRRDKGYVCKLTTWSH